jgi:hypothetical protein
MFDMVLSMMSGEGRRLMADQGSVQIPGPAMRGGFTVEEYRLRLIRKDRRK